MNKNKSLVVGAALLLLVVINYQYALAQYRSGPSGLIRTANINASTFTNVASTSTLYFPCPATNLDVVVSAYNSNGLATFTLNIGVDKSMDGSVWQNALTFVTSTGSGSAGGRLYYITNVDMGNFGFARVRAITNNAATALTNVQVIGTTK